MVDAVESTEKVKKHFTIVSLPAVIWAKVDDESIRVRVQGEPEAVTIESTDDLYGYYRSKFEEHRDAMLEPEPEASGEDLPDNVKPLA